MNIKRLESLVVKLAIICLILFGIYVGGVVVEGLSGAIQTAETANAPHQQVQP